MANLNYGKELYVSNRLVIQALDPITGILFGVIADASLQETHSLSNEITDHPVEDGANIGDHIRLMPEEVTINGIVTDDPISYEIMLENVKDVLSNDKKNNNSSRSAAAYDFFDDITRNRYPVTIYTKNRVYTEYYIKSFREIKDKDSANCFKFSAVFKEVIFVSTSYVETKADTLSTDAKNKGQKKANKGKKAAKSVTPQKEVVVQDAANDITDMLSGYESGNISNIFGR